MEMSFYVLQDLTYKSKTSKQAGILRVGQKNKNVQIYSASILCGALLHRDYWNIFIFSQTWVVRFSQEGSILKKVNFQDVPNYPMWVL